MTRPDRPRLTVVKPEAPAPIVVEDDLKRDVHRLIEIEHASRILYQAAVRLRAVPRYPEIADYRKMIAEQLEEAVGVMREALSDG